MICCKHDLEFWETIDKAINGDVVSIAVFKCKKCGEEFTEEEIESED